MAVAVLWMEALALSLLWVAFFATLWGLMRNSGLRFLWVLPMLTPLLPLMAAAGGGFAIRRQGITPNWFAPATTVTLIFIIGGFLLARRIIRGRSGWRGVLVFAALWLLVLIIGGWTSEHVNANQRARALAEDSAARDAFLAGRPPLQSNVDNAAPLYEQAFAAVSDDHPDDLQNPPFGNDATFNPHEPATHAMLDRQRPTLALLHAAATRPACEFAEDDEPKLVLPSLNRERAAANLLWLHAQQTTADGDVAAAMSDIDTIFRLARHVAPRPSIVSGLVGVGINALGHKALIDTLPAVRSMNELTPLHVERLSTLRDTLSQTLRGEERWGLGMLGSTAHGLGLSDGGERHSWFARSNVLAAALRVYLFDPSLYIDFMRQFQAVAARPYINNKAEFSRLEKSAKSHGMLVHILASGLPRTLESYAQADAGDAAMFVAVAMTRYRLRHGALPSDLNLLVPEELSTLPLDPFYGKPLRITIRGEDRVIYSVGPDGVDNGGAEMDKHQKGDIAYVLRARIAPATQPTTREE